MKNLDGYVDMFDELQASASLQLCTQPLTYL